MFGFLDVCLPDLGLRLGLESVGIRVWVRVGVRVTAFAVHDCTLNKLSLVFWESAWVIRFPPVVVAGAIACFSHTLTSKPPI